jgi:hypothetical protein
MGYITVSQCIDIDIDMRDYVFEIADEIETNASFREDLKNAFEERDIFNLDPEVFLHEFWIDLNDFKCTGQLPTVEYLQDLYDKLYNKLKED